MGQKKYILLLALLLVLAFSSNACTLKGTPRHSLSELKTALLNHDADTASRYIDLDSIVECIVRDLFLSYEAKADDPLQALGIRAGREAAKVAMPAVKDIVLRQVRAAITSPEETRYFHYIRRASVWYLDITEDGDTVIVEPKGNSDTKFRMARAPEGYWKIVEIMRVK